MAKILNAELLREKIKETESSEHHKICIVGIIGNCHLPNKDAICNHIVGKQVFSDKNGSKQEKEVKGKIISTLKEKDVVIKLFHDVSQRIIYLQLITIQDHSSLVKAANKIQENISLTGEHQFWQDKEHRSFAALLFMFSVCHIVLVSFPTPRFDLIYIKLFKLLASVRHGMLHHICSLLSGIDGIPEIWKTTGRPCIPRIIFACQVPWAKQSSPNEPSLVKMQQSLQEQINLILKKYRLLGSLSSSSLFTVSSPNPAFVYVQPSNSLFTDPIHWCIDHLLKNSVNLDHVFRSVSGKPNQSSLISQPPMSPGEEKVIATGKKTISFQDFLNKQIDYMMTVESRDVPAEGRRGTHVEAPQDHLWYRVCLAMFEFFLGSEDGVNNHIMGMASSLDLDWKFSESRCRKVLPLATNAYLDNLPSHYTHSVHLSQLNQALHVFTLNARGPAFEHFMAQLQEDCNQIWWNGRQLCEIRSLTGQPCVYPFHRVPGNDDLKNIDDSAGIPYKPHSSRVTTLAACNCGRTQGTREDPFDLKVANYAFYQGIEKKCCYYFVHLLLPTNGNDESMTNQESDDKAVGVSVKGANPISESIPQNSQGTETETSAAMTTHSMTSIGLSYKDGSMLSGHSGLEPNQTGLSMGFQLTSEFNETELRDENTTVNSLQKFDSKTLPRPDEKQFSTVQEPSEEIRRNEYIDTMLTENGPHGTVPAFPSWSLLCLGPASLYSPSKGIEQQGFFSGSNYLLPWEIRLSDNAMAIIQEEIIHGTKDSNEEQWPAPGEASKSTGSTVSGPGVHLPIFQTISKLRSLSKEFENRDLIESAGKSTPAKQQKGLKDEKVKAHIGNEYECPRGHRFICSGPDRVVKVSGSGHLRDTATKLVSCDMPLYFPCPCRSAKPQHLAQLSRAYVVTPDAYVNIRINPRVQPGESGSTPVFVMGLKEGVCLPRNSYCVLKFPYVYADENGPYLPPHDAHDLSNQKLLKGMYSVGL